VAGDSLYEFESRLRHHHIIRLDSQAFTEPRYFGAFVFLLSVFVRCCTLKTVRFGGRFWGLLKTTIRIGPRGCEVLSDLKIRQAKPQEKDYKLYDAEGLYLQVTPAGGKLWKYKYRFDGKERKLSLGAYPVITLIDAREARLAAQRLLAQGIDPGSDKKARQRATADSENTVEVVTRAWHATFSTSPTKPRGQANQKTWTEGHAIKLLHRLEKDIFPVIGSIPMADLTARDLLEVLQRVAERSLETAHRLRIAMGQVCRWAVATGKAGHDVSGALRGALPPVRHKHMAAPTDPAEVGRLLRAIDSYGGGVIVRAAMQLLPLVFLRPGELRKGRWEEIDFVNDQWNVPAERMKMKVDHIVPLSHQALRILKGLHQVTGCSGWLFPGRSWSRPVSDIVNSPKTETC